MTAIMLGFIIIGFMPISIGFMPIIIGFIMSGFILADLSTSATLEPAGRPSDLSSSPSRLDFDLRRRLPSLSLPLSSLSLLPRRRRRLEELLSWRRRCRRAGDRERLLRLCLRLLLLP